MMQKPAAESYLTQVPNHEGHSDASQHMSDVAGPAKTPTGPGPKVGK
jgi:hypothetical protein